MTLTEFVIVKCGDSVKDQSILNKIDSKNLNFSEYFICTIITLLVPYSHVISKICLPSAQPGFPFRGAKVKEKLLELSLV